MLRIFFFLIGFSLLVMGNTFIILYLNLLTLGYNLAFYIHVITRITECYYAPIGLIILILTITIKGGKKNDIYIRHNSKFSK